MIEDLLKQNATAYRNLGHPNLLYEYVLRQGKEFTGFEPFPDELMEPNECFYNSTHWVWINQGNFDKVEYVEGFVVRESLGMLIHHAWVVVDGVPYEPTLRDNSDCTYYGVAFDPDKVVEEVQRTGYYGLFIPNGMVMNTVLMSEDQPELVEEIRNYQKNSNVFF